MKARIPKKLSHIVKNLWYIKARKVLHDIKIGDKVIFIGNNGYDHYGYDLLKKGKTYTVEDIRPGGPALKINGLYYFTDHFVKRP